MPENDFVRDTRAIIKALTKSLEKKKFALGIPFDAPPPPISKERSPELLAILDWEEERRERLGLK